MSFRFLGLVLLTNSIVADSLSQEDAVKVVKSFLDFHVDQKVINEPLYFKIKKNFVNLFDVEKTYLLEEELGAVGDLSLNRVQNNIENLEKGKFDEWQKEFYAFKHSILRARGLRHEIYRQLLLELQCEGPGLSQNQLLHGRDVLELKERWTKKIARFANFEFKQAGILQPTIDHKKSAFDLFEKKMQLLEEKFTSRDRLSSFFEHFLKAFAKSLDSHTNFFTKQEGLELKKSLEKQFDGIGLSLREGLLGITVTDLVPGAPAFNAGVVKGDILLSVNQTSVANLKLEDILRALEGPRGSEIQLTFNRANQKGLYQVILKRQTVILAEGRIKTQSIPYGLGHIGVVKLSSFYDNKQGASSESDIKEAISSLSRQNQLMGLILDLRQNSGGFLSQAVKVSGLFIKAGVVAVSRYAHGRVSYLRDLDPSRYFDGPLIVLTSKASASAAEVVAGALQDYGRALIVGDDRTYGKGSIQFQNVTESEAKHFYKVTVGRYFTVSGKTTQIEGVKADIQVPSFYHQFNIGERFLDNPLSADRIAPHYIDPLLDIDEGRKGWFQKNYLPFLQTKEVFWSQVLMNLKDNSQFRIEHSAAYQHFLSQPQASSKLNEEDLPLKEAVQILKDALVLNDQPTSSCVKSD